MAPAIKLTVGPTDAARKTLWALATSNATAIYGLIHGCTDTDPAIIVRIFCPL